MSGPDAVTAAAGERSEPLARSRVDVAWDALRGVYDPELYVDVVALGLVYDVRDEEGTIVVEMTLTTPGCPASESLPLIARGVLERALDGSATADVRIVWDPPWEPAMMTPEAARQLGFRAR
jgi:metal-sulfur cluster biosynthetic enzyme